MFLGKGILKIFSKFTGENPCRSVISIKLLWNFIEITLWHGCSPVNLLHIFRIPFYKNTSRGLLLTIHYSLSKCNAFLNLLTANPTKWPTNCLSAFDHFVGLGLKKLKAITGKVFDWFQLKRSFFRISTTFTFVEYLSIFFSDTSKLFHNSFSTDVIFFISFKKMCSSNMLSISCISDFSTFNKV